MRPALKINRWLLILLLLGFVVYSAWYSAARSPWITLSDCLNHPDACHGQTIFMFQEPCIHTLYDDGFDLQTKNNPVIRVYGETQTLKEKEYIALMATFHKDGYLTAQKVNIARKRRFKIWISTLPVLLILLLSLRYFKFNVSICEIEVKDHA